MASCFFGVHRNGRERRQARLAERGVVVDAKDCETVWNGNADFLTGVRDLTSARVVRREYGDGLGQTTEPADDLRHLDVPVGGKAVCAWQGIDMAREAVRGEVCCERFAPGNRPVRLIESSRVVLHLQGGRQYWAYVGELRESARQEVIRRFAPYGVVVAGEAHAGRERMGRICEDRLRVEDHLGGGVCRETSCLLHRRNTCDDAVSMPVVR